MPEYLFVYHGGGMPETEEEGQKALAAWDAWFTSIGDNIVDAGKAAGASSTVLSDGSVEANGGANPVSGYGLFKAPDLEAALKMARGCPILSDGGSVEVAETFEP
ncbi:MAG: hypothetical protein RIC29_11820 [Rhodospirillaceae bacterium]